ncbi:hypothetical protein QJS10_CPB19g01499 [Acorus calamus]|uniref:KNOX1 domain-containing protein n=1 Tax=Acorus calamus TaxID=4465 RepID=A0AAV9CJ22_ACOCL|nr:hypothetical protein QJS10_CPB19g01499 [Acorus calamus]
MVGEGDVEEELRVKRRILCHPMYELLKEAHLDCLKEKKQTVMVALSCNQGA